MLLALALDSRAEVDAMSDAAVQAGGRELHGPEDQGFMYSRAFEDPDGHSFGPFWMDLRCGRRRPAARGSRGVLGARRILSPPRT